MTKKELLRAIHKCKRVEAQTHLTEHDMFYVQVVKADLIWTIKRCDTRNWTEETFIANLDNDNVLWIG